MYKFHYHVKNRRQNEQRYNVDSLCMNLESACGRARLII